MTILVERHEIDFVPARRTASLDEWLNGNWGLLFSHPQDFDCLPVSSRDAWTARLALEFNARAVKPVRVSREASDLDAHRAVAAHAPTPAASAE